MCPYLRIGKYQKFTTEDKIIDFISFMGSIKIPCAMVLWEKYIYLFSDLYKCIESERIEEGTLISSTNDSLDPFDEHIAKCGQGGFKTLDCNQLHSFQPDEENHDEEDIWRAQRELYVWVEGQRNSDKPANFNGNNEILKIFNQKCVICFENLNVYAFWLYLHHNICDKRNEN